MENDEYANAILDRLERLDSEAANWFAACIAEQQKARKLRFAVNVALVLLHGGLPDRALIALEKAVDE